MNILKGRRQRARCYQSPPTTTSATSVLHSDSPVGSPGDRGFGEFTSENKRSNPPSFEPSAPQPALTLGSHPRPCDSPIRFCAASQLFPCGESDLPTCLLFFFNHGHHGLLGMPGRSHPFQEQGMHRTFVVLVVSMCC